MWTEWISVTSWETKLPKWYLFVGPGPILWVLWLNSTSAYNWSLYDVICFKQLILLNENPYEYLTGWIE